MSEKVYIVYQDYDEGKSVHVIAKNRIEARKKVNFNATHVSYRSWLKVENRKIVDQWGKIYDQA